MGQLASRVSDGRGPLSLGGTSSAAEAGVGPSPGSTCWAWSRYWRPSTSALASSSPALSSRGNRSAHFPNSPRSPGSPRSQAYFNHRGIGVVTRLTDFSGYWILLVAATLTVTLLIFAPTLELSRLVTFHNISGLPAGDEPVWPATDSLPWLFALGFLLPAYTITGFDASAHASEETVGAARSVPWGIVRSVLVSGLAGWVMLAAVVLAIPESVEAARQGEGVFFHTVNGVLGPALALPLFAGIAVAQYLCGLATVTSASRMTYAFARDGGLPGDPSWLRRIQPHLPDAGVRGLDGRPGHGSVRRLHGCLHHHHRRLHDPAIHLLRGADGPGTVGVPPHLAHDGTVAPRPLVSSSGGGERTGLCGVDRPGHAATQRESRLGSGRSRPAAGGTLVGSGPVALSRSPACSPHGARSASKGGSS